MEKKCTFTTLGVYGGRELVFSSDEFASYIVREFPWELNELCRDDVLYANMFFQINYLRNIVRTTDKKAVVKNALIATWPGKIHSQVAVIEFMSIQKRLEVEPDIREPKKKLIRLIYDTWGVFFKGKELRCNETLLAAS